MLEQLLPTLLSHLLLSFARDFRIAGERISHPSTPRLQYWSSVLRYLDTDGMLVADVPRASRLSRRMVKPLLAGFEREGGVSIEPGAGRGKKLVRLTPAGLAMKEAWAPLIGEVEAAWESRYGTDQLRAIRLALQAIVSEFELEHPHFPLGYGAVDDSVTGGRAVPGSEKPPFIPPHGKDWVPVLRGPGDTVTSLALPALLSQALVEYALQLELTSNDISLSTAWMVRWLPAGGAPAKEVVATCGDNFKLNAWITRSRIMQVHDGIVTLTAKGQQLRDEQQRLISDVERGWEGRYGKDLVRALRHALDGVEHQLAADVPDHPMVSWVGGVNVVGVDC